MLSTRPQTSRNGPLSETKLNRGFIRTFLDKFQVFSAQKLFSTMCQEQNLQWESRVRQLESNSVAKRRCFKMRHLRTHD